MNKTKEMDGILDLKTVMHVLVETAMMVGMFIWFRKKNMELEKKLLELEQACMSHKQAIEKIVSILNGQNGRGEEDRRGGRSSDERRNRRNNERSAEGRRRSEGEIRRRSSPQKSDNKRMEKDQICDDDRCVIPTEESGDEDEILDRELTTIKNNRGKGKEKASDQSDEEGSESEKKSYGAILG